METISNQIRKIATKGNWDDLVDFLKNGTLFDVSTPGASLYVHKMKVIGKDLSTAISLDNNSAHFIMYKRSTENIHVSEDELTFDDTTYHTAYSLHKRE